MQHTMNAVLYLSYHCGGWKEQRGSTATLAGDCGTHRVTGMKQGRLHCRYAALRDIHCMHRLHTRTKVPSVVDSYRDASRAPTPDMCRRNVV
jgi:hypothetical protein